MKALIDKFIRVRKKTIEICSHLSIEDHLSQPELFVSPPKWQLGHTSWFFEEFVLGAGLADYKPFNDKFAYLFNSYYNFAGDKVLRVKRGNLTRPSLELVHEYRIYIDKWVIAFLSSEKGALFAELVELGLNHEQQHQELLISDIKYILGSNPLWPVYNKESKYESVYNQTSGFLTIDEGIYEVGAKADSFCFDNELGRHKVYLNEFSIENKLVTNGDYLEFIEAGGYKQFQWWFDDAWTWVNKELIDAPLHWYQINGKWHEFTMAGLQEVDKDAILCHVSFYEASAYAEWKGMRLPTEFEWETASEELDYGARWEWTNSAYLPYPDYKKAAGAVGEYNGKFMVNQMVLRGASTATPEGHSRNTYRNFFHADMRWQYSGIRLAKR